MNEYQKDSYRLYRTAICSISSMLPFVSYSLYRDAVIGSLEFIRLFGKHVLESLSDDK